MLEDERIRIVGIKSQLIMAVVGLNPFTQFLLTIGVQVENTRQSGFSILRFRPSSKKLIKTVAFMPNPGRNGLD